MRIAFFSALFALAGMFGAGANASPAHSPALTAADNDDDASNAPSDAPSRPGGNTHYPRNGTTLHKDDDDETGQGAQTLDDALGAAGGQHPGH
ncbi:MAG: hypothetical protein ACRC20_13145 [Segniliparus sp.]|uniref:hypothetical protein n=1 Tax=Segniliparus sp. TaxID=2804064 RepID=UPI003F3C2A44